MRHAGERLDARRVARSSSILGHRLASLYMRAAIHRNPTAITAARVESTLDTRTIPRSAGAVCADTFDMLGRTCCYIRGRPARRHGRLAGNAAQKRLPSSQFARYISCTCAVQRNFNRITTQAHAITVSYSTYDTSCVTSAVTIMYNYCFSDPKVDSFPRCWSQAEK